MTIVGQNKIHKGELLVGPFWYPNFWVPDPHSPLSTPSNTSLPPTPLPSPLLSSPLPPQVDAAPRSSTSPSPAPAPAPAAPFRTACDRWATYYHHFKQAYETVHGPLTPAAAGTPHARRARLGAMGRASTPGLTPTLCAANRTRLRAMAHSAGLAGPRRGLGGPDPHLFDSRPRSAAAPASRARRPSSAAASKAPADAAAPAPAHPLDLPSPAPALRPAADRPPRSTATTPAGTPPKGPPPPNCAGDGADGPGRGWAEDPSPPDGAPTLLHPPPPSFAPPPAPDAAPAPTPTPTPFLSPKPQSRRPRVSLTLSECSDGEIPLPAARATPGAPGPGPAWQHGAADSGPGAGAPADAPWHSPSSTPPFKSLSLFQSTAWHLPLDAAGADPLTSPLRPGNRPKLRSQVCPGPGEGAGGGGGGAWVLGAGCAKGLAEAVPGLSFLFVLTEDGLRVSVAGLG